MGQPKLHGFQAREALGGEVCAVCGTLLCQSQVKGTVVVGQDDEKKLVDQE